jgi:hypothetical protein
MAELLKADPTGEKVHSRLRSLISGSVEIAGGAVTGALGFFAADPLGAALLGVSGSVAAMILKNVGDEAAERILGPREKVRLGAALAISASDIQDRIEKGHMLRNDGFFDPKADGRSDAVEVAEGVLQKAQREVEERKVPYMGYLLSNIAFAPDISPAMAHQIIKASEHLTYRQLCILKLSVEKQAFSLRTADYRGSSSFSKELYQILYECLDLYHRGFVSIGGEVAFGPTDIAPAKLTVQGMGADIFNLMRLASIPNDDLVPIAAQLK